MSLWQKITQQFSGSDGADTEAGWVNAARRGDRRAFDALVGTYNGQLKGFVARRVSGDAVDDLAQEVWIAVWSALPRFEKRACFRTFLYGIAVHKCMDFHRGQKRHAGVVTASALPENVISAALSASPAGDAIRYKTPEELYTAAETREGVREIVDTLPPPQREVLDLYYWAELTLPEVARVLERNLNTVKYHFYRGHDLVAQGLAARDNRSAAAYPSPSPARRSPSRFADAKVVPF